MTSERIQVDEIWSFVYGKQVRVDRNEGTEAERRYTPAVCKKTVIKVHQVNPDMRRFTRLTKRLFEAAGIPGLRGRPGHVFTTTS